MTLCVRGGRGSAKNCEVDFLLNKKLLLCSEEHYTGVRGVEGRKRQILTDVVYGRSLASFRSFFDTLDTLVYLSPCHVVILACILIQSPSFVTNTPHPFMKTVVTYMHLTFGNMQLQQFMLQTCTNMHRRVMSKLELPPLLSN